MSGVFPTLQILYLWRQNGDRNLLKKIDIQLFMGRGNFVNIF